MNTFRIFLLYNHDRNIWDLPPFLCSLHLPHQAFPRRTYLQRSLSLGKSLIVLSHFYFFVAILLALNSSVHSCYFNFSEISLNLFKNKLITSFLFIASLCQFYIFKDEILFV